MKASIKHLFYSFILILVKRLAFLFLLKGKMSACEIIEGSE